MILNQFLAVLSTLVKRFHPKRKDDMNRIRLVHNGIYVCPICWVEAIINNRSMPIDTEEWQKAADNLQLLYRVSNTILDMADNVSSPNRSILEGVLNV